MTIHFLTDEHGQRTAVVIPLAEWEKLMERLGQDSLSPEEAARAEAAWREYLAGEGQTLAEVKREILGEPRE
ncbi:MAG: hypothetical protein AB1641_17165 [Thermodesulfobacteriota bacterium]